MSPIIAQPIFYILPIPSWIDIEKFLTGMHLQYLKYLSEKFTARMESISTVGLGFTMSLNNQLNACQQVQGKQKHFGLILVVGFMNIGIFRMPDFQEVSGGKNWLPGKPTKGN